MVTGHLGLAGVLSGCVVERRVQLDPREGGTRQDGGAPDADRAALSARPGDAPAAEPPGPGEHELGVEDERDSLLHLPPAAGNGQPLPLVVALHGAGGGTGGPLSMWRAVADEFGFAVLAPASRGSTWDAIGGRYGTDVDVVDRSLRRAFELVRVDPGRIAVTGFSDGASYALGLGLANGDLFQDVAAFSPGYVPPSRRVGEPRIFVSHGTADEVLPIDRTGRRIAADLEEDGYDVTYVEFEGGHTVPPDILRRAADRLAGSSG